MAWDSSGDAPTCGGTVHGYFTQPILVDDAPLAGSTALAAGSTDHLKLTAALPTSASGDAFAGAESALNFVFTGVQETGGPR